MYGLRGVGGEVTSSILDFCIDPGYRLSMSDLARRVVVEDSAAGGVPVLDRKWYYSIEVEPGRFTDGQGYANVHLTRSALRQIDVSGLSILDIGSMECLIPILLSRRGAARVVAYDRLCFDERVAFLKSRLGVDFEYVFGLPLTKLREALNGETFDVVVMSGVLYHMMDPLAGLLTARGLVKTGGIIVVETATIKSAEMVGYFNAEGRFYSGDNFWFPTAALLDYLLRLARLKPLDCFHLKQRSARRPLLRRDRLARLCVPCLAIDHAPGQPGDTWIQASQRKDFSEFLDWSRTGVREPLPYVSASQGLRRRNDGSVDLYRTAAATRETRPRHLDQARLTLDAVY